MSVPEPAPKNEGAPITNLLIQFLKEKDGSESAVNLIEERQKFGIQKYGQSLMSDDGRNSIEDARQELGDLMQYLFKAIYNKEDITPIIELLPFLQLIIDSREK